MRMDIEKIISVAALTTSIVSLVAIISLIIVRPWARYARPSNMGAHIQSQSNSTYDLSANELDQVKSRIEKLEKIILEYENITGGNGYV